MGAIAADLEAGLDAVSVGEDQEHAAGEGLFAAGGGVGDVENRLRVRVGEGGKAVQEREQAEGMSHVRMVLVKELEVTKTFHSAVKICPHQPHLHVYTAKRRGYPRK